MTNIIQGQSSCMFCNDDLQRYARQLMLPEIALHGQTLISNAKVLMVGCGGLGSIVGYYLAAAGIARLGIVEGDTVELSNLNRQILHNTHRLNMHKAQSAYQTLSDLNPNVDIKLFQERLTDDNSKDIFRDFDIIADCSDNFPTRFLINQTAVAMHKPLVSAAVAEFEGQLMTVIPHVGHCYNCIVTDLPITQTKGILGAVAGVMGSLQAVEIIKLITNIGTPLINSLLIYDAIKCKFRVIKVSKNPACKVCATNT